MVMELFPWKNQKAKMGVKRFVTKDSEVIDKRIQATNKMCTPVYWKKIDLTT